MSEKKEHSLIQTYLRTKEKYVSTGYRQCSSSLALDMWYYETMVWEFDEKTKDTGKIIYSCDSGSTPKCAFVTHNRICDDLFHDKVLES